MQFAPQKVIYFSGVHGVGKTEIIREIAYNRYIPNATFIDLDQYYHYPKDIVEHQMMRIKVGYESWKSSLYKPIVIVDRGPYDALMYSETYYEFGYITLEQLDMIQNTFQMLPEQYRAGGYIIFLNPTYEEVINNIRMRNRDVESGGVLGDPEFIKSLHRRFEKFYDQIRKVRYVAAFNNDDEKYDARSIIRKLQILCWLQPHELDPSVWYVKDEHGLYAKRDQNVEIQKTIGKARLFGN